MSHPQKRENLVQKITKCQFTAKTTCDIMAAHEVLEKRVPEPVCLAKCCPRGSDL